MGLSNWFRSGGGETHTGSAQLLGLDLNAGRARAVAIRMGKPRTALLDDPREELAFAISLDKRFPEIGQAGVNLVRKMPHLVCENFLPQLGQDKEWRVNRVRIDPESALSLALEKIRPGLASAEGRALALPAYLTPSQVTTVLALCEQAKLRMRGSAVAPLALAAELAGRPLPAVGDDEEVNLGGDPEQDPISGVIRMPGRSAPISPKPFTGLIIDADHHALTASLFGFDPEEVRLMSFIAMPRLGLRYWKDRLLDCLADRCVRVCRRDPRDSATAEQALFEQIDDALDRASLGQQFVLNVRSSHWYQDLPHQADDFALYCSPLAKQAAEAARELAESGGSVEPPRAVWLTDAAAKLPGLVRSVRRRSAVRTAINVLDRNAVPTAVARLASRWLTGALPRVHLDTSIPLDNKPARRATDEPDMPFAEKR